MTAAVVVATVEVFDAAAPLAQITLKRAVGTMAKADIESKEKKRGDQPLSELRLLAGIDEDQVRSDRLAENANLLRDVFLAECRR